MAARRNLFPSQRIKRRLSSVFLPIIFALLCAFILWMACCAFTVRIRSAEIFLSDLPPSFDGTRILFVSDVDLCGLHTPRQTAKLFSGLQAYEPDLLLLGGDYASASLLERLNGSTSANERALRQDFFESIKDFHAPLGKFGVSGDNDGDLSQLRADMSRAGVELIDGAARIITNGADAIGLVGLGAETSSISDIASQCLSGQCVIALMHSPQQAVSVRIADSADGGRWADLLLAGHTHGGQMRIGDKTLLKLNETEQKHLVGWYADDPSPLLVTTGLGCEAANLRLGTTGEVWLLTLRCR